MSPQKPTPLEFEAYYRVQGWFASQAGKAAARVMTAEQKRDRAMKGVEGRKRKRMELQEER